MLAVYICSKCLFTFERRGPVENCPDCGAVNVRFASNAEKDEYLRIRAELRGESKDVETTSDVKTGV